MPKWSPSLWAAANVAACLWWRLSKQRGWECLSTGFLKYFQRFLGKLGTPLAGWNTRNLFYTGLPFFLFLSHPLPSLHILLIPPSLSSLPLPLPLPLSLPLPTQIITSSSFTLNDQTSKEVTEMAHQGIKLLTSWTTAVMELV